VSESIRPSFHLVGLLPELADLVHGLSICHRTYRRFLPAFLNEGTLASNMSLTYFEILYTW